MNRRKFLFGAGAVVAAPAIIKIQNLMPVKTWVEVGYKGVTGFDAGFFYCPYIPLQYATTKEADFIPNIGFKTRYGITLSRFDGPSLNEPMPYLRLPEPTIRPSGLLERFTSFIVGPQRDRPSSESGGRALPDLRNERTPGELRVLQPKGRSAV